MAKMINDDFVKYENSKNDEYIRLYATIIGIDNLISKASSAEEANALFKAKDVIYSQKRHSTYIQPVNDNWISVEEKPPMHGACLAIDVNGNMSITRGWMHIEDKKGRQFYIDSDLASHYFDENGRGKKPEMRICIYENRMTHWQPLPEPPKGE